MPRNTFFLFLILVLIIGALGIGVYLYFFTNTFSGITSPGGITNTFRNFSPFGNGVSSEAPRGGKDAVTGTLGQPQNAGQPAVKLLKLVQNPVAGFIPTTLGSTTMVRYLEKQTGRSFDIDMSIPAARTKITNTTIPRVYQALFGQNGSSVLLRYLDSSNLIQTYSATIPRATSTTLMQSGVELKGSFLAAGLGDISLSPSADKIFTLANFGNSMVGTVSNLDGTKKSQIFDSPFTEWLSSWTNDKTILLATKPSYVAAGHAYALDVKSGSFQKIYGGGNGLTAILSPDGKNLLVSEITDNSPSLKIYNIANRSLVDTGLKTIADKCLWAANTVIYCAVPETIPSADGGYPDAWYQGVVSFKDGIWKIDSATLSTDLVLNISQTARESIDAVNLAASKGGDYLFLINKSDSSLWSLQLR